MPDADHYSHLLDEPHRRRGRRSARLLPGDLPRLSRGDPFLCTARPGASFFATAADAAQAAASWHECLSADPARGQHVWMVDPFGVTCQIGIAGEDA